MNDDDELCLCFHVTQRKVIQYIRVQRPTRASQLSECYGAGTGCGWCRPFLRRLLEDRWLLENNGDAETEMTPEMYAAQRATYRDQKRSGDA